jgi:putative transcriptional regulator
MSELLEAVHEMAQGLYKVGAMDEITMRQIDVLCLPEKKTVNSGFCLWGLGRSPR